MQNVAMFRKIINDQQMFLDIFEQINPLELQFPNFHIKEEERKKYVHNNYYILRRVIMCN